MPAYTALVEVSHELNRRVLHRDGEAAERLGSIDRVTAERHGAIRVGTPEELSQVARIFAALGMHPTGFYDRGNAIEAPPRGRAPTGVVPHCQRQVPRGVRR